MKTPKRIQPLIDDGLVDEVVRRLMSGKEADVYIVRSGDEIRCAKVYKEATKRSFKKAVTYQEGRKVRNSRRARAMEKGSKFGRQQQEETWQTAEVDALYRLADAGVRVPQAYDCLNGVLLMELITDEHGEVAPRLNDTTFSAQQAREDHAMVMYYVMRMLCAGIVHGDLSEFNVLVDEDGPVIIDLPQAVDAAGNNNAKAMLERDVNNITRYYAQYAPELIKTRYGQEIWSLFENGLLEENTILTGKFKDNYQTADVDGLMDEINSILADEQAKQQRLREDNESD